MSGINRSFFLKQCRLDLFDGSLSKSQALAILAFLDRWEDGYSKSDDRWLAYIFATVHHETGRTMRPVRETFASSDAQAIVRLDHAFGKGKLVWVKVPYWRKDQDGKSWYGRGYVQITHKANYQELGKRVGVDLEGNPDLALDPEVAQKIIFIGMMEDLFTGHALSKYFNQKTEDWRGARRIINHLERADLVASYARKYYRYISYTVG